MRMFMLLSCCLFVLQATEMVSASGVLRLQLPDDWVVIPSNDPQAVSARNAMGGDNLVLYESTMENPRLLVETDLSEALEVEYHKLDPAARVFRSTFENAQATRFVVYTTIVGEGGALKSTVIFCADAGHLYKIIFSCRNDELAKAKIETMLAGVDLLGQE